jgi:hypothetical protein
MSIDLRTKICPTKILCLARAIDHLPSALHKSPRLSVCKFQIHSLDHSSINLKQKGSSFFFYCRSTLKNVPIRMIEDTLPIGFIVHPLSIVLGAISPNLQSMPISHFPLPLTFVG